MVNLEEACEEDINHVKKELKNKCEECDYAVEAKTSFGLNQMLSKHKEKNCQNRMIKTPNKLNCYQCGFFTYEKTHEGCS